ncbi:MAG TPA: peptidase T [Spirochaetia bacterium]|nr:peptidase T [Spirochaetia bacterium]
MIEKVTERFFRYVKIDTQSAHNCTKTPSTPGQMELARLLKIEMSEIGFTKTTLSEQAYLYGFIPGTDHSKAPIGYIAHLDTSPSVSGKNVKPIRFRYDGDDILAANGSVMIRESSQLSAYTGNEIITGDGTTLLGADNKAGIAEILTACEYLIANKNTLQYPDIYVAFVPDEEIGHQLEYIDLDTFKSKIAFTIDGGEEGEIEYGCFNAYNCTISISGKNCHPGYANGKLISSIEIITIFLNTLFSQKISPNESNNDMGYIHVSSIDSNEQIGQISLIIRDFTEDGIKAKISLIETIITDCKLTMSKRFNENDFTITASYNEEYKNMESEINKHPHLMDTLKKAVIKAGATPILKRIRGGTDGSALSSMGIPCPNIFTGGINFHSTGEWIPVDSMEKAVKTIIELSCMI